MPTFYGVYKPPIGDDDKYRVILDLIPPIFRYIALSKWVGDVPPWIMRIKFFWQCKFVPKGQTKLNLLDYRALRVLQSEGYLRGQEIKENKISETELLRKSWLNLFPHEVWQVRIRSASGISFVGKVHHGSISSASTIQGLRREVGRVIFLAQKKGIPIYEVELAHTHPSIEVLIVEDGLGQLILNGISKRDMESGQNIAPFTNYPLRVCAITPAANYSMLF